MSCARPNGRGRRTPRGRRNGGHISGTICASSAAATRARISPHPNVAGRRQGWPLHQENALAGSLSIEQAVGFVRLVELPLMGEEAVDVDFAFDDEARAVGLALPRKGPGANDR